MTTSDAILESIRASTRTLPRLQDLDLAGRGMMAFMRGHMSEILEHQTPQEYFAQFYTATGREFLQYDDYSFVLHHCMRYQFWHWKEEIDLLRRGPLGAALERLAAPLPELRHSPVAPTRRPPVAKGWYDDVYLALEAGVLPEEKGVRNEVLAPEDCVLAGEPGMERIWGAFLVYACDLWGRQIPVVWDLVREMINTRRLIEEQLSSEAVDGMVADDEGAYREASLEFSQRCSQWQEYHAATVGVHDPMFDKSVQGLFGWAVTLAPDISVWGIKDIIKDEMYREVAATVLKLRGKPTSVELPEPTYWRALHFAPDANKIGAPGMPPFV